MVPNRWTWLGVWALTAGCVVDRELGGTDDPPVSGGDDVGVEPRCAADDGAISLPAGFCASVVADGLGKARHLAVTPSGTLYVAVQDATDGSAEGGLVALRDADDDGVAEAMEWLVTGGGNGVEWHDGRLFFARDDRVLRIEAPDGAWLEGPVETEVVVSGLPDTPDHAAKTVVVDDRGNLFVHVGSASNACQEENRELHSPGLDPCPELEERAGIWRFDANGTDLTPADGERFATGLRNANAMAIHPTTGELYAAPNGRDQLHENWPELYSLAEEHFLPAEELFRVVEGTDGGWPYCYFDPAIGHVLAPEYGGDGETVGRCAAADDPIMTFPAHWAPLGMHFYEGTQFPELYRGGLFVAFHGSWHGAPVAGPLPGYQVGFLRWDDAGPDNLLLPFAWDFAGDALPLPEAAAYRPVDVAEAPDGSLYLSDDVKGRIWRVFYTGG